MTPPSQMKSSFDDWDELYDYVSIYGVHLLLGVFLSAVTIFRREMSCNRVFHQVDDEDDTVTMSPDDFMISDELEEETEDLLEGAGMFCSGQLIVQLASLWVHSFPCDDEDGVSPDVPAKLLQDDVGPSDLLERAGNFCSGEPFIAAMALFVFQSTNNQVLRLKSSRTYSSDPFTNDLPPDVHVHIASFLHPKDVVSLSCVSRSYRSVVDQSDTSRAIWKTLWQRDYAWVVHKWKVGREALGRSKVGPSFLVDKDFYFFFGQTYLDYVLAGQNTVAQCLVGLHCHIYDITSFLDTHPGSPDTLMVHSGKDSTRFFEDMGHSLGARRLAKKFCVVADLSQSTEDGWGLRPTPDTVLVVGDTDSGIPPVYEEAGRNLQEGRRQKSRGGTLNRIRSKLGNELIYLDRYLTKRFANNADVLGAVHPYYDPFRREWRVWYTNSNLESVFLPA